MGGLLVRQLGDPYSVAFNFEWQGFAKEEPVLMRHRSIATSPGGLPSPSDVGRIMMEFSFGNPLDRCLAYETAARPDLEALNVVEAETGD